MQVQLPRHEHHTTRVLPSTTRKTPILVSRSNEVLLVCTILILIATSLAVNLTDIVRDRVTMQLCCKTTGIKDSPTPNSSSTVFVASNSFEDVQGLTGEYAATMVQFSNLISTDILAMTKTLTDLRDRSTEISTTSMQQSHEEQINMARGIRDTAEKIAKLDAMVDEMQRSLIDAGDRAEKSVQDMGYESGRKPRCEF